jgi:hypothetical protein
VNSSKPSAVLHDLWFIWSHRHPFQRGPRDPSNPVRASKDPYDSFPMKGGIGHLAVIIIFLVTKALNTWL